jgi:hypothetical protein
LIPTSHHGAWRGVNRLWFGSPEPERSDGTLDVAETTVSYTWVFQDEPQQGRIALFGPSGAVRAEWTDTFHAADGMTLHGQVDDGVLVLFGTYAAGDSPEWGWRIDLDTLDPEHLTLRMFNLLPAGPRMPAVALQAAR